ncbi:NACHT domain-containing protein [Crocosphaera sp.]|uniref:NACHT domain-containing protein n=1 Tax=Crocosphaera sp. TaxID=2729996 RepID=UPI003F24B401|nr:hypothetical protein [Crocosphaera sp.]
MTDTKKSNFVEQSIKFLARYAPATASGWLFFLSFKDREWLKVIISIPPIILSTIWATYSQAFLDRLTEIYTEEGKKGADAFKRFTDSLIEAIKWFIAKTDDKYLKCQSYPCYDYQIEGMNQSFIPQLEEIFVPLELDLSSGFKESNLSYTSDINTSQDNALSIWDILNRGKKNRTYRRLLIKSQGGYGKTTLLRHITYLYTQKCQRKDVPELLQILLRLRKWQTEIYKENAPDLPTLIEKYHIPNLPNGNDFQLPSDWAKNNLDKGKFLILWDGFDEVKPELRQSISQWLGRQMFNYPNSFFILTS